MNRTLLPVPLIFREVDCFNLSVSVLALPARPKYCPDDMGNAQNRYPHLLRDRYHKSFVVTRIARIASLSGHDIH